MSDHSGLCRAVGCHCPAFSLGPADVDPRWVNCDCGHSQLVHDSAPPPTPERDRELELLATGEPDIVRAFVTWLLEHTRYGISTWSDLWGEFAPLESDPEVDTMLCEYYGIDREKTLAEREALLAYNLKKGKR